MENKTACGWPELTEPQLLELRQKHGDVTRLSYRDHFIYVRQPRRVEFREYTASRDKVLAMENFVKRCLVHPSPADFDAHLERFPALGVTFCDAVMEIAGGGTAEKKNA